MRKLLIVASALGAVGFGVVQWQSSEPLPALEHDATLIKDRLWCDHVPRSDRDKMNVFVALTQRPRQPPIGLFEEVSMWEGHFEAFRHESIGEEMRAFFPQSGDRETLTLKASRCTEPGMDFCLEVEGSKRGVRRYYSRKGWEIRSTADAQGLATSIVASVAN